MDRATGRVVKKSPRVLTKGVSAEVEITLRSAGGTGKAYSVPLETFSTNKEMGRILIRRGGETIAAGMGISPSWFDPTRRGVETDSIQLRNRIVY